MNMNILGLLPRLILNSGLWSDIDVPWDNPGPLSVASSLQISRCPVTRNPVPASLFSKLVNYYAEISVRTLSHHTVPDLDQARYG